MLAPAIEVHRSEPAIKVGAKWVSLTNDEHRLITVLAMMDNRVVPHAVLLDAMCEHRVQIPADRDVLAVKISRLRKKVGSQALQNKRKLGYRLSGSVEFVG